ncbi:glycosyltransferase [Evansella sp. AB-rgal1]|uniref:glycosyltransferase n=1 Tax=Evansella sp. AB-rgal1 TaxID=3242696 RepID=UPI00359E656F
MLFELVKVMRDKKGLVVLFMKNGDLKEAIDNLGVETILLESPKMRNAPAVIKWMISYSKLLTQVNPNIVLNWMPKAHKFTAIPNYVSKKPTCWWQHGVPEPAHFFDKLTTILPAETIGASSTVAKIAQLKLTNKHVFCVYPGSDIRKHSPSVEKRVKIRKELGISDDTILIGNVGRIQSWKKQDKLIEALEILVKQQIKVKLLLVGGNLYNLDDEYENKIHRLIADKKLEDYVISTGNQKDVTAYYDAMDLYVHTASGEPFGIVMVEAMLHEKPVIAVKSPGSVEIVEHGKTGLLLDSDNPLLIVSAVKRFLTGNIKVNGKLGRERAITLFSNTNMGLSIIGELEKIGDTKQTKEVVV